ncbi:MAG: FAD-binding protein [Bdellovibrionales bacterium]
MNPWTNFPVNSNKIIRLPMSKTPPNIPPNSIVLGNSRSYGDVCIGEDNSLILSSSDHFLGFDSINQTIKVEGGVLLDQILKIIVPRGFFLPVTPGTKFITVAGAVANDIHGKNHVLDACFGNHVTEIGLKRSSGEQLILSPTQNSNLFKATIGGLGLTGIVEYVEFKLKPISNSFIDQETIKFANLKEFIEIAEESKKHLYTVAWVDCLAKGSSLGRGLFMRGNPSKASKELDTHSRPKLGVPFSLPNFTLNKASMWLFNQFYYNKQLKPVTHSTIHYDPFFYPLDGIKDWNRIYGSRGFLQYQFALPFAAGYEVLELIFKKISASGMGSFLAVLKTFGDIKSPGLLSFPIEGYTLALDFAIQGPKLFSLLNELDEIVVQNSGRIYPGKDARMSSKSFKSSYPQWEELESHRDPMMKSKFWNRVTMGES